MKKCTTADRLKQLMEERNLKQADILCSAKPFSKTFDIKLGRNDLSQYVSGKVEPGQRKLYLLARALNVNEAWLMGYDVPMERMDAPLNVNSNENNHGVIGNVSGGAVNIKNQCKYVLTKQEQDILRIYNEADGKTQIEIMNFMYGIENK